MIPTSHSTPPFDDQMQPDFCAIRWQLEWWVLPDGKTLPNIDEREDLLVPKKLAVNLVPFKWDFLDWPDATQLKSFRLSSCFKEEVKTNLRKRSKLKGNYKNLFLIFKDTFIPFEVLVYTYPDHTIAINFQVSSQSWPASSQDLINLSLLPLRDESLLSMAVDKICEVLQKGDVKSRPVRKRKRRCYPYIHIFEHSSSQISTLSETYPWRELVQIGTRHIKISDGDRKLIDTYKAKNLSLRDGVLVVDKQSTLVVSPENYLELQGITYCLAVALRMRHLLEQSFRGNPEATHINNNLLQRLKFTHNNPSAITDSCNHQFLWPAITQECMVMQWLSNVETSPHSEAVSSKSEAILQHRVLSKGIASTPTSDSLKPELLSSTSPLEAMPVSQKADITILTILPEEYQSVCNKLIELQSAPLQSDHPNLYAWKIGKVNSRTRAYTVAVGMIGRAGTTESALATRDAIQLWDSNFIFFVGVAGGLKSLNKGDIVIADIIHGYEYGKIENGTFTPRSNWTYKTHIGLLNGATAHIIENWQERITVVPPISTKPKAIPGEIASGDKVIDDPNHDFFVSVLNAWPKIVAIEMEGAGAGNAIEQTQALGKTVHYMMIRGISDLPRSPDAEALADENAHGTQERDSWKAYAADTAAAFTVSFIEGGLPLPPRK